VNALKEKLVSLRPAHDSPPGRLHPYWARKPLNILREIVKSLSVKGDIVIDPFMGSGTVVLASLLEKRNVMGADINPLASLITMSTLELCENFQEKAAKIEQILAEFEGQIQKWFLYEGSFLIERERFAVVGRFEYGNFELIPTELVVKPYKKKEKPTRRVISFSKGRAFPTREIPAKLLKSPINFGKEELIPNARIAVPAGAKLSHYFTDSNQAAINLFLSLIKKYSSNDEIKDILTFLLSTSLPLLRLSDYKASSQWPYWRPKLRLTSRNPLFVLRKRFRDMISAQAWLANNMPRFEVRKSINALSKGKLPFASLANLAIQDLRGKLKEKADLVITDPPYADQAPYLEYSNLWIKALGLPFSKRAFDLEIVKTDAATRKNHSQNYRSNISNALKICAETLKEKGWLVWFYQDSCLKNWADLYQASRLSGLNIKTVVPIEKQRRSMKTVTTPGRTFDGDLILIFRKEKVLNKHVNWSVDLAETACFKVLEEQEKDQPFFFRYAEVIFRAMQFGWIEALSKKHRNVRRLFTVMEKNTTCIGS
jgi:DNA modification methylase